jgi:hypothetical protein
LEHFQPDAVLIEGPPDADGVIPLVGRAEMEPPVALLLYNPEQPSQAAWYPFAGFSPEWVAIRHALGRGVPVAFMDLPQKYMLAFDALQAVISPPPSAEPRQEAAAPPEPPAFTPEMLFRLDPTRALAEIAGYSDSERWWDVMVEQGGTSDDPFAIFAVIAEAMGALREAASQHPIPGYDEREALREAHMRKTIRAWQKQHTRIAVVCGAWHVAALSAALLADKKQTKADNELLKELPGLKKVEATWAPWTYDRLASISGYGAGITSPGWYAHLWETPPAQVAPSWLARVAALLRAEDLSASTAQVIDGVRLAETLAALRSRAIPTLDEMNETALAVFCRGDDAPMRLIEQRLIVGMVMGAVPPETPTVPLQRDLEALQKELKFKPTPDAKDHDFDLRKPLDLGRSVLLHRLALLGIEWGVPLRSQVAAKGSFHEFWRVHWQPELTVRLIEASRWGNTIRDAAAACATDAALHVDNLLRLVDMLDHLLLADLADAASAVVARLADVAALTTDVAVLMDALPRLVGVLRYGDVRGSNVSTVGVVVDGLVTRIGVGLLPACVSLDDDAANAMFTRINAVASAVGLAQRADYISQWLAALSGVADSDVVHRLVVGRAVRLLRDGGTLPDQEVIRRLRLALARAVEPAGAAAWLEGFLRGSGALLLHDDALWDAVDAWLAELPAETFEPILPLLRRTFSSFTPPERRQMGERAKHGRRQVAALTAVDPERAKRVLPVLARILGVEEAT